VVELAVGVGMDGAQGRVRGARVLPRDHRRSLAPALLALRRRLARPSPRLARRPRSAGPPRGAHPTPRRASPLPRRDAATPRDPRRRRRRRRTSRSHASAATIRARPATRILAQNTTRIRDRHATRAHCARAPRGLPARSRGGLLPDHRHPLNAPKAQRKRTPIAHRRLANAFRHDGRANLRDLPTAPPGRLTATRNKTFPPWAKRSFRAGCDERGVAGVGRARRGRRRLGVASRVVRRRRTGARKDEGPQPPPPPTRAGPPPPPLAAVRVPEVEERFRDRVAKRVARRAAWRAADPTTSC
jgi:hypothetical protein